MRIFAVGTKLLGRGAGQHLGGGGGGCAPSPNVEPPLHVRPATIRTYFVSQVATSVLDHSVDVRFQLVVFSHEFVVRIERP